MEGCPGHGGWKTKCLFAVVVMLSCVVRTGGQECSDFIKGVDFTVTADVVELVGGNLQKVVDCVPNEGLLKFDPELITRVNSTIELNRPILVSSDGLEEARPVLQCPEQGDAVFNIRSSGVIIQNLVLKDCNIASDTKSVVVINLPRRTTGFQPSVKEVVLEDVLVSRNKNSQGAGSILVRSATSISFSKVAFENNLGENGGAILLDSQDIEVQIDRCIFRENMAMGRGGAIYQKASADVVIVESNFLGNSARYEGGAIGMQESPHPNSLFVSESTFQNNSAAGDPDRSSGGALSISGSPLSLTIIASRILNNRASLYGGGIKISDTQNPGVVLGNVDGSIFAENTALMGGAIYVSPVLWSTSLSLHNTTFLSNNATSSSSMSSAKGGALYVQGPLMQLNVTKNLFDGNQAIGSSGMKSTGAQGGAMFVEDLIWMSIIESVFTSNKASHINKMQHSSAGGAIFFLETGMNRASRVKDAAKQSACHSQCDSSIAADKLGLQNAVAGCGETRGMYVCILRDHTKCRGIRTTKIASKLAAECEVVDLRGRAQVSGTVFSNNGASEGGAVAIDGAWTLSLEDGVWFSNNRAHHGGGAVIARRKAQIWGSDVVFSGNEAGGDGGALFLQGTESQVVLNSSALTKNEAVNGSGGALMLLGVDSLALFENFTEFVGNKAGKDGGAISIYSASTFLNAQQVLFEDNKAKWNGGGLHAQALHGTSNIILEDVSFIKNSANYLPPKEGENSSMFGWGGAISLHGSGIELKTHGILQFISNEAKEGGAIRLMESGPVDIVNAAFHDNSGLSGGAIHATFGQRSQKSALSIENAAFWKNTAFMGGGLMIDAQRGSRGLALDDPFSMSLFDDFPSTDAPQLIMKNIEMWEQAAAKEGAGILLIDAAASCYNCSFTKNSVTGAYGGAGGGISLWRTATFNLENGIFNGNSAVYGGGVSVVDSIFNGKQLDFFSNAAQKAGGAIFVRSQNRIAEQLDRSLLEVTETKLRRNRAKIGAGIYGHVEDAGCTTLMNDYRMLPHSIDFFGSHSKLVDICRQAESGFRRTPAYLTLLDVEFRGNMASAAGGAVYINAPEALCVCCGDSCSETCRIPLRREAAPLASVCSNYWTRNSVSQGYGSLIASGPLTAEVVLESGRILRDGDVLEEAHNSGDSLAVLTVRFLDFSQSVVYSMPAGDFVYIMSQTGALSGQTDKQIMEGVAKFNGVYFTGQPGNHTLSIKFPESLGIANHRIRIQIRDCQRGERSVVGENSDDFKCVSCGNMGYNFDPGSPCQPCPENAQCDGENIVPENGYWQSMSRSTEMQECPRKYTCTYSDRANKLMNVSRSSNVAMNYDMNPVLCSEGYEGVMCGSCSEGYGQMSGFKCQKCLSKAESVLTMSFISFWAFLVFCFFVQNALASGQVIRVINVTTSASHLTPSGEESSGVSAGALQEMDEQKFTLSVNPMVEGIKILINFLQVTSMAAALDSDWTTELKLMFNIEDFLSGVVTNTCTGSFECAIRSSPLIPSVQRVVLMLTFPVGFALLMTSYWCLITFLKQGSWRYLQRRIFITFLVTCFLFYTEVTETVFQIFSCVKANVSSDGVSSESVETVYWAADTNLEFFKGTHRHLISLLGIPFLALFSIGFPAAVFIVLWRNKHKLYHDRITKRFGFLYQAYSEKWLYWELMVFARKAIIAGIAVFGYHWGPNLQELGASGVLFVALIIHLVSQPYREEIYRLNHMETLSLTCSFCTYSVGLALNDKVLPVQARHVLSGLAIGLTVLFVTVLFAHLIVDGYRSLRSWIHGLGIEIPENASLRTRISLVWQCVWNNCMCWFWKSLEKKLALPATRRPLPWNDGIMLSSSRISMSDRTERITV